MPEHVLIFEMAPRDGLQNEARPIPTADKVALIDRLSACGFQKIETVSFVSPKWVPQMADGAEVMATLTRAHGTRYTALTPNLLGYERAREAGADEVAVFGSASEGFSQKNINCSIEEGLARFAPVCEAAARDRVPVRGYVSCVTDCPYDGSVAPQRVTEVAMRLHDMGCYEISLGDTIGAATPESAARMLDAITTELPPSQLAGHFHDTRGRALENIAVSLDAGLRVFDASAGGLGGCPYAPGAKGNVDTMAVAELLANRGFETGLDLKCLAEAASFARTLRTPA
ncbi:MAG: hydroxymethylglutaryl-CoA lyase [Pseudomonadota bacterium]